MLTFAVWNYWISSCENLGKNHYNIILHHYIQKKKKCGKTCQNNAPSISCTFKAGKDNYSSLQFQYISRMYQLLCHLSIQWWKVLKNLLSLPSPFCLYIHHISFSSLSPLYKCCLLFLFLTSVTSCLCVINYQQCYECFSVKPHQDMLLLCLVIVLLSRIHTIHQNWFNVTCKNYCFSVSMRRTDCLK